VQHPTQSVLSSNVVATLCKTPRLTIGVDLGDMESHYCVLNPEGKVILRGRLRTTASAFGKFFAVYGDCRVAYEVGTHSAWVTHVLGSIGCETRCQRAQARPDLEERAKERHQ